MATADTRDPALDASAAADKKRSHDRLHCVVVTPETTLFDDVVDFVALPLYDGELGVLPGRAPLIGRLGYGELRTRVAGLTQHYFVDGGFAQVRDDVVTVLTNRAIPADRIVTVAASEELERANALRATTDAEQAEKERSIARARAQLRVAAHAG
jgi:F-type H+-transporting ATPase subunit epsilon